MLPDVGLRERDVEDVMVASEDAVSVEAFVDIVPPAVLRVRFEEPPDAIVPAPANVSPVGDTVIVSIDGIPVIAPVSDTLRPVDETLNVPPFVLPIPTLPVPVPR